MSMLQGNTYLMPIRICDADGGVIKGEQVEKGEFVFGEITKFYGADGEVVWDESREAFILPLSEEETFGFKGVVEYQGRVLLKDGSVSGSVPKSEDVYASIGTTILSDGGVGEESGEILTIKLLDRVINTGITEEVDPTVPQYIKEISEQDIENWNKVKSLGNVFKYKGSVQTYAELPTENNVVGDTYNVIEAYGEYGAGTNFAWSDAGEWDALSGIASFDADGYVTAEEYNKLVNNEVQIVDDKNRFLAGGASTYSTSKSVAIGRGARTDTYNSSVAIGENSQAQGGVAIGYNAKSEGVSGVQLGTGTNKKSRSLQVRDDNIYDCDTHTATFQNIEQNGNPVYAILQGETAPTTETIGAVGQFYLDTTEKKLYQCTVVADGVYTWQAVGSGVSQEDFDKLLNNTIKITNDSQLSFHIGGAESNSPTTFSQAVGVGYGARTANSCLAIGNSSSAGNYCTVIGNLAEAKGQYDVAIGYKSSVISGANLAIAIGNEAKGGNIRTIAIGKSASATATNAIQLGSGTNNTVSTLQIGSDNIYNFSTHTLTVQNIELNGENLADKLGGSGVSQEDFDKLVNNETQIKTSSNGFMAGNARTSSYGGIAIGEDAQATGASYSIAIGKNSVNNWNEAVALGAYSAVYAQSAIQLGRGANSKANSLQIHNDNIYNSNTHTLTVQNIELNGENLADKLANAGGGNAKKYQHNIQLGESYGNTFVLFSVITDTPESYTTMAQIIEVLDSLGQYIVASGFKNDTTSSYGHCPITSIRGGGGYIDLNYIGTKTTTSVVNDTTVITGLSTQHGTVTLPSTSTLSIKDTVIDLA